MPIRTWTSERELDWYLLPLADALRHVRTPDEVSAVVHVTGADGVPIRVTPCGARHGVGGAFDRLVRHELSPGVWCAALERQGVWPAGRYFDLHRQPAPPEIAAQQTPVSYLPVNVEPAPRGTP